MNRTELKVGYDEAMKPISASCTRCGERMLPPPSNLQTSADIIYWFSREYLEHRKAKHPQHETQTTNDV